MFLGQNAGRNFILSSVLIWRNQAEMHRGVQMGARGVHFLVGGAQTFQRKREIDEYMTIGNF